VSFPSGLRFEGTAFWVRHRNEEYGPFDYEWSQDLSGIEMTYRRQKFGEFCSADEIFADLKEFSLPMRVVEVSSIISGTIVYGILHGFSDKEKREMMKEQLKNNGLERFAQNLV
jgi:hypothetical protein